LVTFVGAANQAIISYDPNTTGSSTVQVTSPATIDKFQPGTNLYQAMVQSAFAAHNALLSAHNELLAPLTLLLGSAKVDESGWCACNEDGVSHNKYHDGYKPKCIDLGNGQWDCDCVQK
jgi:hypothetical protein